MNWTQFDADKINPKTVDRIKAIGRELLPQVNALNETAVINGFIEDFNNGKRKELTKVIFIDIFCPNEFASLTKNDCSLEEFSEWLLKQKIDWEQGSETLKRKIKEQYADIGKKKIEDERGSVILDNLIKVGDKRVAIEIETSTNLDNGYFTLREAMKENIADYGIMIVPWIEIGSGRANERKALGRLDREFDNRTDLQGGPIFRIAPVRIIDAWKEIIK